ncbi:hypothetical protein F4804DRAFT_309164 [Jackrogersella minutella]|nr:hypothetical protein F4804DRAFT_309164 [Jackrogersella minutella]
MAAPPLAQPDIRGDPSVGSGQREAAVRAETQGRAVVVGGGRPGRVAHPREPGPQHRGRRRGPAHARDAGGRQRPRDRGARHLLRLLAGHRRLRRAEEDGPPARALRHGRPARRHAGRGDGHQRHARRRGGPRLCRRGEEPQGRGRQVVDQCEWRRADGRRRGGVGAAEVLQGGARTTAGRGGFMARWREGCGFAAGYLC